MFHLPVWSSTCAGFFVIQALENHFSEQDKVVCVSEDFPWLPQFGGTGPAAVKPQKGEVLIIDEILGDFLRFDKYDTEGAFNWWHHTRFARVDEQNIAEFSANYEHSV